MKIGIIGGGQLAQMLALAGHPLGLKTICLEPTSDCPAGLVTEILVGQYDDTEKLQQLAGMVDVITYEFENIPAAALASIDQVANPKAPLSPPATALAISQDRLQEKRFFEHLQIPTTHYVPVDSADALKKAAQLIGFPAILKTRRLGYDGKGQLILDTKQDLQSAWLTLKEQPLLLENKIAFEREVSCIGVRSRSGEIIFYALVENQHKNGILHLSQVVNTSDPIEKLAQEYVTRILNALNYIGVLTVEFFQQNGQLLANEVAPRVHNSGHWTIEGADTSQFENHLRAVAGLPLGSTTTRGKVAMVNLIGEAPSLAKILSISRAHCHLYGKIPRPGRKLGHITLCADEQNVFDEKLQELLALVQQHKK